MSGRIKKSDTVVINSGKDRGREAKVLKVYPSVGKILAEGINMRKVHKRPRRSGEKGSIVEMHFPFAEAKAMPKCPHCGRATRVAFSVSAEGIKGRVCKKCKREF